MSLFNVIAAFTGGGSGEAGGSTDNSPILSTLISGGAKGAAFEPGTYLFNSTVAIPDDFIILGSGRGITVLQFAGTGALFTLGHSVTIKSLTITGTSYTNNRTGVSWNDKNKISIEDVEFLQLKYGAYWTNVVTSREASVLVNCFANSCDFCYYSDLQGEYVEINNCHAYNSITGAYLKGGNTRIIGGSIVNTDNGIHVVAGTNHAHSVIQGVSINHITNFGILVDTITLGMNISNNTFFSSAVKIQASQKVSFNNNFGDSAVTIDGTSSNCQARLNRGMTITDSGTGNDVGNNV
jgi:hypothetical protein